MTRMTSREKVVHIRRNVENFGDPYLRDMKPEEAAVCQECRCVYAGGRWQLESQAANHLKKAKNVVTTVCPACRKTHDRMPGGVVTLAGQFVQAHREEILNLLHNESERARTVNPLERIMDIEQEDSGLVVLTTNEKMAQRIGRAMQRAYDGDVQYKWSRDTKLIRVNWRRD